MKINTDCLREVMLEIEKSQQFCVNDEGVVEKKSITINTLYEALPKYSKEDVFYCLYNLDQVGYVSISVQWIGGKVYNCMINHMTFAGHEFLNRIRDSKRWSVVKSGLSALKDYSLAAISAVAEGVANAALDKTLAKLNL